MSDFKRRILPSRLGLEILLYFLLATAAAAIFYLASDYCSNQIIYERFTNSAAVAQQTQQELESFLDYVAVNDLSTKDTDAIRNWVYGEKYVLLSVFKDEYLVYSNYPNYGKSSYGHSYMYQRLYDVAFSDGTAQVGIYTLAASKIYDTVQIIEIVLALLTFVVLFLMLFSSKFKYISRLQNEMEIIGSGNLDLPVTIKGNDEITFLALGLDEMRKSFLERIKNENEARRANSELITSISHDLRTPLTILIGNLDVITNQKYKNEEQRKRYIENCRKKAYQLKELSDKLFEYFFVFGSGFQEPKLELVDGSAMLAQLIEEYSLALEDQGFPVTISSDLQTCLIEANIIAVRRVFDNLFGNIEKYAVSGSRIEISAARKDLVLSVRIKNEVKESFLKGSSTNIGLATCEKIMEQHAGVCSVEKSQRDFSVTISFPIKQIQSHPQHP